MKYVINLFGNNMECTLSVEDDKLVVSIPNENQNAFKSYLQRVLLKHNEITSDESDSLEAMLRKAIEIEKKIGGYMNEPKLKLPYEFAPEIKEKLIEAAALQEMSATQLLTKLIESKYNSVMNS